MVYLNKRDSYSFAELLADETTYNIDLNKDGSVGDVIAEVLTNDGNGHGLYKTVSGSYVIDDSGLSVGSATTDPTILITQKRSCVARQRRVIMNLHKLQRVLFLIVMAAMLCITKIQKGIGLEDRLVQQVYLRLKETYTLSQLFADESKYKNDLNNDGNIGDVITAVIGDNGSIGLYQTGSGSYLIDNSGLGIGDSSVSPTLLVSQKVSRGKTTTSLYDFNDTPTGTVALTEGGFGVYYQRFVM